MKKKTNKMKVFMMAVALATLIIPATAQAEMYVDLYGELSSGNWNPFITDVATSEAFVGWENSSIRNNEGEVSATIYWKDSSGKSKVTTDTLVVIDAGGFTGEATAKSGNDNSDATGYHTVYLNDKISGQIFTKAARTTEN